MWGFHLPAMSLSALLFPPSSPLPQSLNPSVLPRGLALVCQASADCLSVPCRP